MTGDMLWWDLLSSGLLAGGVAIGATVVIERLGGRLGGLIGTLPTTILPASLGIFAQTPTTEAFAAAMGAVPAGMLINAVFLYLWRIVPPHLPSAAHRTRLLWMVGLSVAAWALGAWVFAMGLQPMQALLSPLFAGGVLLLIAIVGGILACLRAPPAPAGRRHVGLLTLLSRGLLAGGAIAVSVVLAAIGGPIAAGMASVFPAIFLTTMVSLWLSQGEEVQAGAVGPMMLGSTSVSAYALLAAFAMPMLGSVVGAGVAWVVAVVTVTVPAWLWLRRRNEH